MTRQGRMGGLEALYVQALREIGGAVNLMDIAECFELPEAVVRDLLDGLVSRGSLIVATRSPRAYAVAS